VVKVRCTAANNCHRTPCDESLFVGLTGANPQNEIAVNTWRQLGYSCYLVHDRRPSYTLCPGNVHRFICRASHNTT